MALDDDHHVFLNGHETREFAVAASLTPGTPSADAARQAGQVGASARGRYSTTAAHVVAAALDRGWPVLTADPGPLEDISPCVLIERLP
jgi:hypothetical protein